MKFRKKRLRDQFKSAAMIAGIAIAFSGIGYTAYKYSEGRYTKAEGKEFLESMGYTHVRGGTVNWINGCGKGVFAREYECTNKDGKEVKQTVCFSMLYGKYRPLFGKH